MTPRGRRGFALLSIRRRLSTQQDGSSIYAEIAGGDMWSMLVGAGPLLGNGVVGSFLTPQGEQYWYYQRNTAGGRGQPPGWAISADTPVMSVEGPEFPLGSVPLAVLFDNGTSAAGEATAIAFAGRAREHSFGVHTSGGTNCCDDLELSDGAHLYVPIGIYKDRNGRKYPEGLSPDTKVAVPTKRPPQEDPVVLKALAWLSTEAK
jgi:carboxyl-terminal processing protease